MTVRRFASAFSAALALASASLVSPVHAQQPQRLAAGIHNESRATLPGSQPARVRQAQDLGAVDGATQLQHITLTFSRSAQQQADLEALLAAQQDPSSPQYHQWLTSAEFGARFGMADADIAKTQAWLQSQGFTVDSVSPSRNSIVFSGTAAAVANAFNAPLHRYSVNGRTHMAPSADLTLPAALANVVLGVRNLSDFRPQPRARHAVVKPNFTSSQTGNHFLTPGDIATIYDIKAAYNAGYNGSGQTIAITGQSAVTSSDITNFQTAIGQSAKAPIQLLVPNTGASTHYQGDESESDLDLEYATGIAPGATVYFVYVGANATSSVFDSLTYAIQNRIANIINISYGQCEPLLGSSEYATMEQVLQQAAAQGQTVVSASGDSGSTDCFGATSNSSTAQSLAVDFPSSSEYVTGVGGTEFSSAAVASGNNTYFSAATGSDVVSSALSYIPEQVWNDDTASDPQSPLSSGGGGISAFTARPTWQAGVPGIPSGSMRLVPDIALNSSPNNASYAYCSSDTSAWASGQYNSCNSGLRDSVSQNLTVAGGTSFAAPIFAGMVAILNQAKGYTSQGLVNPTLYSLAANSTTYASAFHDITSGGNYCNIGALYCLASVSSSYAAGTGYDLATGLGSVDFNNLLTAWPANSAGTGSTKPGFTLSGTGISVSSGSTGTSTITVTPVNGYTGTIQWAVAPSATVTTNTAGTQIACYSIANTSISGTSSATATLTVTTANAYNSTTGIASCPSGTKALGLVRSSSTSNNASLSKPRNPAPFDRHSPAVPASLAALGFVSCLFTIRSRSRRLPALLAFLVLTGVGFGLSGCGGGTTTTGGTGGGGGNSTPTTTSYTLTVVGKDSVAAAPTITAQTTIALTITQQ